MTGKFGYIAHARARSGDNLFWRHRVSPRVGDLPAVVEWTEAGYTRRARKGLPVVSSSHLDDPEHWRKRAREVRDLAAQVGLRSAKERLLDAAAGYDRLAERAEERSKKVLS
jgi:hypothetical protein